MEYKADSLILRTVTAEDVAEVARTWLSAHWPISETETVREIVRMEQNCEKNRGGDRDTGHGDPLFRFRAVFRRS